MVPSNFPLTWVVVFFFPHPPPHVRIDPGRASHTSAALPPRLCFLCSGWGRTAPVLGMLSWPVSWSWTKSCLSPPHRLLDCATNERSKTTASKRKWFVLWGETWKEVPPRTLRALFCPVPTAGLTHFKITKSISLIPSIS